MFKKEKGITLVALVVTIIILLILAGVALSITLGDNGLFRMSQNAANAYTHASDREESTLTSIESEVNALFQEYMKKPQ